MPTSENGKKSNTPITGWTQQKPNDNRKLKQQQKETPDHNDRNNESMGNKEIKGITRSSINKKQERKNKA